MNPNSFPCKKCGQVYTEESGAFKGFTCENCKAIKSYICPSCKEKQTTAYQWQSASIPYLLNLEDKEFEPFDSSEMIIGDHEEWTCPNCGEPLPDKIENKLFKIIGSY